MIYSMSTLLTAYYDPDDPPEPDRMDEADRLLGVSMGRALLFLVFLAVVGADPTEGLRSTLHLFQQNLIYGLAAAGLMLWALFPLLRGLEHMIIDTKNAVSDLR